MLRCEGRLLRLADGERVDLGGLAARLRVNRRARRCIVRIDHATREAVVVAPSRARLAEAVAFACSRRGWIAERLAAQPTASRPAESERLVRARARFAFAAALERHCAALDVTTPRFTLSGARGRWGSCTPPHKGKPGSIRLSWRLAFAPEAVADYVVAHECAHLLEANHSPAFWALVRRLVGDPAPPRRWLKTNGARLHAISWSD